MLDLWSKITSNIFKISLPVIDLNNLNVTIPTVTCLSKKLACEIAIKIVLFQSGLKATYLFIFSLVLT